MASRPMSESIPLGILSVLITMESLFTCYLVIRYKKLRNYTNGFVISLVFSDLLIGAVILPMTIADPFNPANGFLVSMILLSNVSSLFAVTLDRFIAINKPLLYMPIMRKYFGLITLMVWLLPIAASLLPLIWQADPTDPAHSVYILSVIVLGIIIPFVFIFAAYIQIFLKLARYVRSMAKMEEIDRCSDDHVQEGQRISAEASVARVFAVIAGVFILAWLPIVYMSAANAVGKLRTTPQFLFMFSWYTLCLGSLVHAPIFAFMKSDFKTVIKTLFGCQDEDRTGPVQDVVTSYDVVEDN